MPYQFDSAAFTQPPLFEPDWIVVEVKLNLARDSKVSWGGVMVTDGDTGETLFITAESFPAGVDGLEQGIQQLRAIAVLHFDHGSPFPA